jgi:hypothetical protein
MAMTNFKADEVNDEQRDWIIPPGRRRAAVLAAGNACG